MSGFAGKPGCAISFDVTFWDPVSEADAERLADRMFAYLHGDEDLEGSWDEGFNISLDMVMVERFDPGAT